MSFPVPDAFPSLGIPISRLIAVVDDLGGPPKAGALSCGEFYTKCIRPMCKGNGLPLAQQIALNDDATRSGKPRCTDADTVIIQGGGHGFIDTCVALALHMPPAPPPPPEADHIERARFAEASASAARAMSCCCCHCGCGC